MSDLPSDDTGTALRMLIEEGSDLSRPLVMDFHIAVPDHTAGEAVAAEAQQLGFDTKVEQDPEDLEWTCYCTQELVANYDTVTKLEAALDAIARPLGGYADGFGSFGNQTAAADMTTLVDCCIEVAQRASAPTPSRAVCHEFLAALLRRKEFVECAHRGIITRHEARDAVMAHMQTFLQRTLGVPIPTSVFEEGIASLVERGLLGS